MMKPKDYEVAGMKYRIPTVFITYDIENDSELKDALVSEAEQTDSLFEVLSVSTKGDYADESWVKATRREIDAVDKLVVILGPDTHTDLRVAREVKLGMECNKPIVQLRIQGTNPRPMPMHKWNWVYIWEQKAFIQLFRPIEVLDH